MVRISSDQEAPLLAGAASTDITPPPGYPRPQHGGQVLPGRRGARPLCSRTVVVRQGDVAVALVSLDICAIGRRLVREIERAVAAKADITPRLVLNCSHSHEAPFLADIGDEPEPGEYDREFVDLVSQSILRAGGNLEPVKLSFAQGHVDGLNRNRRKKDQPVDKSLAVLRLQPERSDRTLALLWRFSAHPIVHQDLEHEWTPDFPGVTNEILESRYDCQCQYLQGLCGDSFPLDWYFGQPRPRYPTDGDSEQFMGEELAHHLEDLLRRAQPLRSTPLVWAEAELELPMRSWPFNLDDARQRLKELEPQQDDSLYVPWAQGDHVVNLAQRHELRYQILILRLLLQVAARRERTFSCPLSACRLGDLLFASIPGELFSKEGFALAEYRSGQTTLVLNCTNGYLLYLPSRDEMEEVAGWDLDAFLDQKNNRWAYGASVTTYVRENAADQIVETLKQLLDEVGDR